MNKLIEAKDFAIKKHGDQFYGTFPYEVHLINVVNVLLFIYTFILIHFYFFTFA
ncbi:MAG: hypothetical protein JWO44_184 [Bacteroidetes bacterium]|nr:hypothetical protein [Bacteroidota bacterium]